MAVKTHPNWNSLKRRVHIAQQELQEHSSPSGEFPYTQSCTNLLHLLVPAALCATRVTMNASIYSTGDWNEIVLPEIAFSQMLWMSVNFPVLWRVFILSKSREKGAVWAERRRTSTWGHAAGRSWSRERIWLGLGKASELGLAGEQFVRQGRLGSGHTRR